MSEKNIIYKKKYIKVQEAYAEMGGFMGLTIFILTLFASPFIEKKKYFNIMNEFFDFDNHKEEKDKQLSNIKLKDIKIDNSRRVHNQDKKSGAKFKKNEEIKNENPRRKIDEENNIASNREEIKIDDSRRRMNEVSNNIPNIIQEEYNVIKEEIIIKEEHKEKKVQT